MTEVEVAADWSVGHEVVVKTSLGEELSGTVFAYDKPTNVLVLKEAGSHSGVSNMRILRANFIQEVVSAERPKAAVDLRLPYVDLERCKKREEKAIQQAELESSRVGVGVTKDAQAIFDALVKTMPCLWKAKVIVVLDCVYIDEPYTVESCRSDADHQTTLERVRKVLQAERQRLAI